MRAITRIFIVFLCALSFCYASSEAYAKRTATHKIRKSRPKKPNFLFVMFPELKPPAAEGDAHPSLALQNRVADASGLPRIADSAALHSLEEQSPPYLVKIERHAGCFWVDPRLAKREFKVLIPDSKKKRKLAEDLRYANPAVVAYFEDRLSGRYCDSDEAKAGKPFIISSLVRTEEYQRSLAKRNPNAKQAIGDTDEDRSAHLTGYAFDILTKGHTNAELIALAALLLEDKREGYLAEVIFEPHQNNFHAMVNPQKTAAPQKDE